MAESPRSPGSRWPRCRRSSLLSALLAALASLGLGLVLGPEAPLTALGLTAGLVAARALRPGASGGQLLVVAGAFAAISTVFGGPLPSALLLFELVARSGMVPSAALGQALLPGFLASGTAALVFTGVDHWPGVAETVLQLPPLPDYPTVRLVDVAWCVLVAVVAAVVAAGARRIALEMTARTAKLPLVVLLCAAAWWSAGSRSASGPSPANRWTWCCSRGRTRSPR